jgi:hypothetical protein
MSNLDAAPQCQPSLGRWLLQLTARYDHTIRLCVFGSQLHDPGGEALHHFMFKQVVPILGEARLHPDFAIHGQSDEPAAQQVVANLLNQLVLAAHREKAPNEHGSKQFLKGNRRTQPVSA